MSPRFLGHKVRSTFIERRGLRQRVLGAAPPAAIARRAESELLDSWRSLAWHAGITMFK